MSIVIVSIPAPKGAVGRGGTMPFGCPVVPDE
jgi:hypothetical protein